jgi:tetratricopeptide (TPR) repeat protein
MNNYKLCIYAICKNEEQFVENWFDNMAEADYICVLDTGSNDSTYEKLKNMKDKYESLPLDDPKHCTVFLDQKVITPWRFDEARNDSLKLCPEDTDIFMCTDLDELLNPGWSIKLREKWDPEKFDRAMYLYTWSHLDNGAPGRIFNYDKIHGKGMLWKFPVHECLCHEKDLSTHFEITRYLDLRDDIMLEHWPDKNKSRSSYLPLLELRAREYPEDTWGLMYLAHEYYYRKMYEKSIDVINNIISRKEYPKFSSVERSSCYLFRGDDYKELGDYPKALADYMEAMNIDKTLREPYLKIASLFIDMKLYSAAIEYAKKAIENGVRHYSWIEKDHSWSYEPYDTMAIASFYGGNKRDSLAYAYKAYSYDTSNERLKINIELILGNTTETELIK